jgi:hypothetical protein
MYVDPFARTTKASKSASLSMSPYYPIAREWVITGGRGQPSWSTWPQVPSRATSLNNAVPLGRSAPSTLSEVGSSHANPQLARTGGGYSPANPLGDRTEF